MKSCQETALKLNSRQERQFSREPLGASYVPGHFSTLLRDPYPGCGYPPQHSGTCTGYRVPGQVPVSTSLVAAHPTRSAVGNVLLLASLFSILASMPDRYQCICVSQRCVFQVPSWKAVSLVTAHRHLAADKALRAHEEEHIGRALDGSHNELHVLLLLSTAILDGMYHCLVPDCHT
jgi:hypothetical protein